MGGENDAIVSRPRPVLCRLQEPEELDDRVPLGHAAEELTGSMLMILINQSEAEYTREYHKGEVRMVSGLVEVFLPGPLLHHAAEDGQLVEAAPGENLCVPGHQEVVARPECLVTIIAVASRQPPEGDITTAVCGLGRSLLMILLRGEGVAVIAVIVVKSVTLLIVGLTELVMIATRGSARLMRFILIIIVITVV